MDRTMRKTLYLSSFLIAHAIIVQSPASAADCTKTCVEVRSQGGELIITARRDPIRVLRPTPSPTPSPIPSPTANPTATPTSPPATARSQPRKRTPRPSLSDQIREILPEGRFEIWPKSGAIIYEPLLVRAFGCSDFAKVLPILDTTIELHLTPRIEWLWGDGEREIWGGSATRGAHIYNRSGRHVIQMRCLWSGRYRTPYTTWARIPEGIYSTAVREVELFRAQVFFTQ